jgi:predicted kinase
MIYALIGIPGSGKSTLARTMVRYMNAVIINKDSLREMLFGYTEENVAAYWDREDINKLEKQIVDYQDTLIKQTLNAGRDVILDNTHVRLKYINDLKKYGVTIRFIPVNVDFETALERDSLRTRSVGRDVLAKFYGDLEHLKKEFDFKDYVPHETLWVPNFNPANGSAFIFDIDGTLALNTEERSPYDYSRVNEDEPNNPVVIMQEVIRDYGYDTIICSGRPEKSRKDTEKWLEDHGIRYHKLFMRPDNDNRKDFIVKEELWREILKTHNIIAMFDDRKQVVDHARKLGFTVFQVAPGNF